METLLDILLDFTEFFTLLSGLLGILLSGALLVSLNVTKAISDFCNQNIDVEQFRKALDKNIKVEGFIYRNHILFGLFLLTCSFLLLLFLSLRLNIPALSKELFLSGTARLISQIFFQVMSIFSQLICSFGIFVSLFLVFFPGVLKRWETRFNYWIMTEHLEEKLNEVHKDTDTLVFLHPLFFGFLGLTTSLSLLILSVINLLK